MEKDIMNNQMEWDWEYDIKWKYIFGLTSVWIRQKSGPCFSHGQLYFVRSWVNREKEST